MNTPDNSLYGSEMFILSEFACDVEVFVFLLGIAFEEKTHVIAEYIRPYYQNSLQFGLNNYHPITFIS